MYKLLSINEKILQSTLQKLYKSYKIIKISPKSP